MNCNGCGVEIEPSEAQVNAAVDGVLTTSLEDAKKTGGVCPLCGHSMEVPYAHKKPVLFALLAASLLLLVTGFFVLQEWRTTERSVVIKAAIARISSNPDVIKMIGVPITAGWGVDGQIEHDETGWQEARLVFPVHGPHGQARVQVIAGKGAGAWNFTTFEIEFEQEHKKLDLISGRIVEYDPNAYEDVHTQKALLPQYSYGTIPAARLDGTFPCVSATVEADSVASQFGRCDMPTMRKGAADRFSVDLRDGSFVLQQTDLEVKDVFDVPLTRSYRSNFWIAPNHVMAFGRNSSHPYDIAPLGTRNPYTYQLLVLENGDFLYFDRISKGSGYADAVYMHTETSTPFYKATEQWNGNGWTMKLADGSQIVFPESYSGKNLAQGAPTEIIDPSGNRLELVRDGQRNLQEIKTPHGHWIKLWYDDLSRVKWAQTDAGQWAQYQYNSDGILVKVACSSGRRRSYEYQGDLMTRVTDEEGHVLVQNHYNGGLVARQQFENGDVYSYRYDWDPASSYPRKVSVTLPDQATKELSVADSIPQHVLNLHR